MRILQILPALNVGGVETGTVDFAKYLRKNGHYNIVVSNGGMLVSALQRESIKHYTLPVHKKSLWTVIRCVKHLKKIIISENIEIVCRLGQKPTPWSVFG